MGTTNCYVVLGIMEDADDAAIRSAFRTLARRYHPDVGPSSSATEFRRALEAYETLSDPDRRRRHDRELRAARSRPSSRIEPIVSGPKAEPLFGSPVVFVDFPEVRPSRARSVTFDTLFDELLTWFDDRLPWPYRRW
jgi:curved DNA-binding protein CbpA